MCRCFYRIQLDCLIHFHNSSDHYLTKIKVMLLTALIKNHYFQVVRSLYPFLQYLLFINISQYLIFIIDYETLYVLLIQFISIINLQFL
ncbi:hypothetical protein FGO68_gene3953 [Halteria grandinella]|uniref:Transmembrane protein n=1 Tax=Halteria grandinella TaxID=5974 RepID=A0A8J8NG52_HALGN|nr:hypothetical protein FGO68_gene3953 [Halteria grandinella]